MIRGESQAARGDFGHFLGIAEALDAGAGIGIAGIGDDRLRGGLVGSKDADFNRRRADLVGGKEARYGGRYFRVDQGQIALLAFVGSLARPQALDIAKDPRRLETFGGGNSTSDRSK